MNSWSGCLAIGLPGGSEWLVIALFGLLLFGKRLPEVARSMGKSVTEFKKGLQEVTDDVHKHVSEDQQEEHLLPPASASSPATPVAGTSTPLARDAHQPT